MNTKPFTKIAITGAAGRIGYNILFRILDGELFGRSASVSISCIDIPIALPSLDLTISEVKDCNFPNLHSIFSTSDYSKGFADCDFILLLASMPLPSSGKRSDLLEANAPMFKEIGETINRVAKPSVKIIVVANPANTLCWIVSHFAQKIPKNNFTSLSRLDQQRAKVQAAMKAGVPLSEVSRVGVYGNHSPSQVPSLSFCQVGGKSMAQVVEGFDEWYGGEFANTVRLRHEAIVKSSGYTSVASAGSAALAQMRDLCRKCGGKVDEDWGVVGVYVKRGEEMGIKAKDVYVGMPCLFDDSRNPVAVREALQLPSEERKKFEASVEELKKEKKIAMSVLKLDQ